MTSSTPTATNHEVATRSDSPLPRRAKDGLAVTVADVPRGALVCVNGAAGAADLGPLDFFLTRLLARRPPLVLLDFSELTLLSSLAMGLLVRFRRDLARWGGRVRIAGAQPSVRESLEVARHDSGILTAEALAALDLDKMELAGLSACEAGLGDVAGGEGVLGLKRAFQVAGARSTVTSLWQVDDRATRELMERFYAGLWDRTKPLGKLEALRQAQLW